MGAVLDPDPGLIHDAPDRVLEIEVVPITAVEGRGVAIADDLDREIDAELDRKIGNVEPEANRAIASDVALDPDPKIGRSALHDHVPGTANVETKTRTRTNPHPSLRAARARRRMVNRWEMGGKTAHLVIPNLGCGHGVGKSVGLDPRTAKEADLGIVNARNDLDPAIARNDLAPEIGNARNLGIASDRNRATENDLVPRIGRKRNEVGAEIANLPKMMEKRIRA